MHNRAYRGTNMYAAADQELGDGRVHGEEFEVYSGFMAPDDIDNEEEYVTTHVDDLPWDVGPDRSSVRVVGGFSDRLGPSTNFAGGPLPLVFHLDKSRLSDLSPIQYNYRYYDGARGTLPWVAGNGGGELRINESLQGLTNPSDTDSGATIRYYGDGLRSKAQQYADEMEWVIAGRGSVDISRATDAVVSYVTRPMSHLSELDGYTRFRTKRTPDSDVSIKEWSDEQVLQTLYDELRMLVGGQYPAYLVHTNTTLANDIWSYSPQHVEAIYGPEGEMSVSTAPDHILGD